MLGPGQRPTLAAPHLHKKSLSQLGDARSPRPAVGARALLLPRRPLSSSGVEPAGAGASVDASARITARPARAPEVSGAGGKFLPDERGLRGPRAALPGPEDRAARNRGRRHYRAGGGDFEKGFVNAHEISYSGNAFLIVIKWRGESEHSDAQLCGLNIISQILESFKLQQNLET